MAQQKAASLATVRRIALAFPELEEGTPGFRVRGRFMALQEDGEILVVKGR